jgi:hypothetical protein
MRVVEVRHIEDCVDGSSIREYVLDEDITKEFVDRFFKCAENVQYFGDLERPFFKLETAGRFVVKGVEGNRTLRVTVRGQDKAGVEAELVAHVDGCRQVG